jgi:hypothetical protein
LPDTAGPLTGFNPAANYSWTILTASSAISGFDPAHFFLNTSGFAPYNPYGGSFSLTASGNNLNLLYTGSGTPIPEPSTWFAAALLTIAAWLRWSRRSRKNLIVSEM